MRNKLLFFIFAFLMCFNAFGGENKISVQDIFRNIKCLACSGQSIEDSNSDFSQELRKKIKNRIDQGATQTEIYSEIKKEYGEEIFFTSPEHKTKEVVALALALAFILLLLFFIYLKPKFFSKKD